MNLAWPVFASLSFVKTKSISVFSDFKITYVCHIKFGKYGQYKEESKPLSYSPRIITANVLWYFFLVGMYRCIYVLYNTCCYSDFFPVTWYYTHFPSLLLFLENVSFNSSLKCHHMTLPSLLLPALKFTSFKKLFWKWNLSLKKSAKLKFKAKIGNILFTPHCPARCIL